MSGVDLARQALLTALKAAKRNGATRQKPKRRATTVVRRDGRELLGLGSAINRMMTERGMAAPTAGGSVLPRSRSCRSAAAWISGLVSCREVFQVARWVAMASR